MGTHYQGTDAEKTALCAHINLIRAAESVMSRIEHIFSQCGLTESQFGVLEVLLHLGPLCQRELGQKILKSSGNITMVVDNLEKQGLVLRQRDNRDRRYITVHLTDKGRQLITEIFPSHARAILQEMSVLSLEEQAQLRELCRKLGLGKPEISHEKTG